MVMIMKRLLMVLLQLLWIQTENLLLQDSEQEQERRYSVILSELTGHGVLRILISCQKYFTFHSVLISKQIINL